MKLREWIEEEGITPSGFARHIGVPPSTVQKILREDRAGNHDTMVRIIRGTRGAVLPNDFFDIPAIIAEAA
jgi:predicted transcriptional regulator